ncbi:hypothetical protein HD553DRAFT_322688 [Filobasidium floriforme]|uniref:uncharacterized protein n=1 Tax=Filobasidium floriforme TaxID=5210 RepID=UPI001E8DF39D|nr:uncharacterized protein HD553DRAFT_322688 [Filobasidium floriforme]KAH8088208.1 hypothetical protein HD553DRAFT_322688 [Filobasidium floriforme]
MSRRYTKVWDAQACFVSRPKRDGRGVRGATDDGDSVDTKTDGGIPTSCVLGLSGSPRREGHGRADQESHPGWPDNSDKAEKEASLATELPGVHGLNDTVKSHATIRRFATPWTLASPLPLGYRTPSRKSLCCIVYVCQDKAEKEASLATELPGVHGLNDTVKSHATIRRFATPWTLASPLPLGYRTPSRKSLCCIVYVCQDKAEKEASLATELPGVHGLNDTVKSHATIRRFATPWTLASPLPLGYRTPSRKSLCCIVYVCQDLLTARPERRKLEPCGNTQARLYATGQCSHSLLKLHEVHPLIQTDHRCARAVHLSKQMMTYTICLADTPRYGMPKHVLQGRKRGEFGDRVAWCARPERHGEIPRYHTALCHTVDTCVTPPTWVSHPQQEIPLLHRLCLPRSSLCKGRSLVQANDDLHNMSRRYTKVWDAQACFVSRPKRDGRGVRGATDDGDSVDTKTDGGIPTSCVLGLSGSPRREGHEERTKKATLGGQIIQTKPKKRRVWRQSCPGVHGLNDTVKSHATIRRFATPWTLASPLPLGYRTPSRKSLCCIVYVCQDLLTARPERRKLEPCGNTQARLYATGQCSHSLLKLHEVHPLIQTDHRCARAVHLSKQMMTYTICLADTPRYGMPKHVLQSRKRGEFGDRVAWCARPERHGEIPRYHTALCHTVDTCVTPPTWVSHPQQEIPLLHRLCLPRSSLCKGRSLVQANDDLHNMSRRYTKVWDAQACFVSRPKRDGRGVRGATDDGDSVDTKTDGGIPTSCVLGLSGSPRREGHDKAEKEASLATELPGVHGLNDTVKMPSVKSGPSSQEQKIAARGLFSLTRRTNDCDDGRGFWPIPTLPYGALPHRGHLRHPSHLGIAPPAGNPSAASFMFAKPPQTARGPSTHPNRSSLCKGRSLVQANDDLHNMSRRYTKVWDAQACFVSRPKRDGRGVRGATDDGDSVDTKTDGGIPTSCVLGLSGSPRREGHDNSDKAEKEASLATELPGVHGLNDTVKSHATIRRFATPWTLASPLPLGYRTPSRKSLCCIVYVCQDNSDKAEKEASLATELPGVHGLNDTVKMPSVKSGPSSQEQKIAARGLFSLTRRTNDCDDGRGFWPIPTLPYGALPHRGHLRHPSHLGIAPPAGNPSAASFMFAKPPQTARGPSTHPNRSSLCKGRSLVQANDDLHNMSRRYTKVWDAQACFVSRPKRDGRGVRGATDDGDSVDTKTDGGIPTSCVLGLSGSPRREGHDNSDKAEKEASLATELPGVHGLNDTVKMPSVKSGPSSQEQKIAARGLFSLTRRTNDCDDGRGFWPIPTLPYGALPHRGHLRHPSHLGIAPPAGNPSAASFMFAKPPQTARGPSTHPNRSSLCKGRSLVQANDDLHNMSRRYTKVWDAQACFVSRPKRDGRGVRGATDDGDSVDTKTDGGIPTSCVLGLSGSPRREGHDKAEKEASLATELPGVHGLNDTVKMPSVKSGPSSQEQKIAARGLFSLTRRTNDCDDGRGFWPIPTLPYGALPHRGHLRHPSHLGIAPPAGNPSAASFMFAKPPQTARGPSTHPNRSSLCKGRSLVQANDDLHNMSRRYTKVWDAQACFHPRALISVLHRSCLSRRGSIDVGELCCGKSAWDSIGKETPGGNTPV